MSVAPSIVARAVRVEGTVQGVGFRPFVYRLSRELGLTGWVLNDERGVLMHVEGPSDTIARFEERLTEEAPPLARVESIVPTPADVRGAETFEIVASASHGLPDAPVSPDSATCAECLVELFDPADRRHRYPFVNCTNCGPRFTIVRGVPYDRPLTTMASFAMCVDCQAEYDDAADRRFHAQPNACAVCGPSVRLVGPNGDSEQEPDPIAAAAAALLRGAIVAVKGIGGYHLACVASLESAVSALRSRKHREDRPFALMVPDVAAAHRLAVISDEHERLLTSPARPIVLAPRRHGGRVAHSVAPGAPELGLMLPYSPLHHLLLADAGVPLVLTSGNVSDEPIAYRDEDALERLAGIADLVLVHDRPIHTRTDDGVVRVARRRPMTMRRSRGDVPGALDLPVTAGRDILATGAELKSTFCLARGRRAWVGHHIGDLKNLETLSSFAEGVAHFETLFAVTPAVVAHDLHPDYLSTRYALERDGVEHVGVQHHHAHLAAVLAEHGETGPAIGAIYDGAGLGTDGTVWGGELLVGELAGFERAGHLLAVRLPGGDAAAREPWRMACAWLVAAGDPSPAVPRRLRDAVDADRWAAVVKLVHSGLASPLTTSAGRLFDAVAALAGVRAVTTYEGQAAIELEAAADPAERGIYRVDILRSHGGPVVLDPRAAVRSAASDAAEGVPAGVISTRFHHGLAVATARACAELAVARGMDAVVLSGGVFANRILLERAAARLERRGLRVLVPERLPPGDGGISFGQAAVAAARGSAS